MNIDFKFILKRFHREQKGAALTEFILFLPIWITVFIGVANLGKLGIESTKVQMIAQKKMWSMAIDTSTSSTKSEWGLPLNGGKNAASTAKNLGRGIGDGYEALISGGQTLGGHWGESYLQTLPISLVTNSVKDLTHDPSDIIGDTEFPSSIVNDSPGHSVADLTGGGGFKKILTKLVSGSGATASFGAGIRYGLAHGRHSESISLIRGTSIKADFHYDVIAAPSPVTNTFQPFAVARLMAEMDSSNNYSVMMNFGNSEWKGGGNSGSNDLGIDTDWDDLIKDSNKKNDKQQKEADKEKEKECKENPSNPIC